MNVKNNKIGLYLITSTLFCLILICCVQMATAQDYKPFPTSNAMWRERFDGFEVNCENYQYLITGDTIINGLTYHKLQKSGILYFAGRDGCDWNNTRNINEYAGCFRNDTSEKKVYYIYSDTEELIYDFSLSVGDTIPEPYYYSNYHTIESIDSIEIGGKFHKRFKIDNCGDGGGGWELYIIEGIGSTYGLLSPTRCPFESNYWLLCLSINGETFYPWQAGCDAIRLGMEDYSQNKTMISLFPNPATGELKIGSEKSSIKNVEIFDIYGRKQNAKVEDLFSVESKLDISHLSVGIYFVKIYTEAGEVMRKVLKE